MDVEVGRADDAETLIFVNYRGSDAASSAAFLHTELARRFGEAVVFLDYESISLGRDFEPQLLSRVRGSAVLLAVIGDRWLAGDVGQRPIDDPDDWVRRELVEALDYEIPVVPVLFNGASLSVDLLPTELAVLGSRQYFEIRARRQRSDIAVLGDYLARQVPRLRDLVVASAGHNQFSGIPSNGAPVGLIPEPGITPGDASEKLAPATLEARIGPPTRGPIVLRGREDLLQDLLGHLHRAHNDPQFPVEAAAYLLHGPGGVGKSAIALTLTQHLIDEADGAVFWLDCTDDTTLRGSISAVAASLGASSSELDLASAGRVDLVELAWRHLTSTDDPWLIVFDGADDTDTLDRLARFVSHRGGPNRRSYRGMIIGTTRASPTTLSGAGIAAAEHRRVAPLSRSAGGEMLLDLAEGVGAEVTEPDRVAAEAIADRLAGLPIAIAAAGKNLAIARRSPRLRPGRATFTHYLERMNNRSAPADLNHLETVRSAWETSLRLIDRGEDLGPRAILDVISVLARGDVPIMLLGHLAPADDSTASEEALDRIEASIMGLEQIGLVDVVGIDPDETPMQPASLQLHAVVGDAFRDAVLAGVRTEDVLVRAADAAHRRARDVDLGTAEREHLARHVTELTRYGSQLTVDALERLVRTSHEIGGALIGSNLELAVRTLESASTALGLIPDPPVDLVIGLHSHLGLGLDNWGRRDQAREQVAQALALATDALGGDDPRTLRLRGQYALLNDSVDDLAAVIERMESLLGRRSFETLVMRGNLAVALLRAERYSAAREQYERILDIIEVQWPDDVESIVTFRRNLVRALMRENATASALDNIKSLVDDSLAWGLSETNEYQADLVTFQSLLIQANDPRGDITEVERAVERVCAALGRSNPRALIALGDYMAALEHRGMYPRAVELSREIERGLVHRFGEFDHNSIVAAVNLVTLLERQEKYLETEQLLERLEQNSRRALGADSPIHQHIRDRLDTYRQAFDQIPNWEARCRDDKVLLAGAIARDVVDNRSGSTATQRIVVRANLAEHLDAIGMARDAAEIWSQLVVDHEYEAAPEYIRMRYAQYLKNTDRVDEAKSEYMHLVDRYADDDRPAELVSRLELAECHIASDEQDLAMAQLRRVHEILETDSDTEFGDDARASSLHRLAGLLDQCGDRETSAAAYERVLGMFVDSDAELGRNFLTTYHNYRGLRVVRSPELSQRLEAILGHETVLSRIEHGGISADSISRDSRQMIVRLIDIAHQVHDPDEAGLVQPASPSTTDEATDRSELISPIAALAGLMVERGESDPVVLRLWEGTATMIAEHYPEEGVLQYRELLACHRYSGGPPSTPARRVSRALARLLVDRECFFEAEQLLHTISTPLGAEPTSDELAEKCEWVGALRAVGRLPEAEGQARACLAAAEGRRGDAWGELRAKLHRELAGMLVTLGRNSEAVDEFRACVDAAILQWGHNHHNTMHLYAVARNELELAALTEAPLNPSLDRIFRAR